jgi:hypothetical protein
MSAENPLTYVWYQFRLQVAAGQLWDAGGLALLREFYEHQRLAAQQNGTADASPLPSAISSVRDAWPEV